MRVGSGRPRRIVSCALDQHAYAVSQITQDGYLRVHRIGPGSRHPLWDQAFEAQQVRVLTLEGPIAGVVARSNGHFAQQHRNERAVVTADDLWVDVGAKSADDIAALGIRLLDPIVRHLPPWVLAGGYVAGPDAGRRVGCAAVATLALVAEDTEALAGETHFVMSAQSGLGWVGLSSLIARGGTFDSLVLLAPGETTASANERPATSLGAFGSVLQAVGLSTVRWIVPRVQSAGAHMERISFEDAEVVLAATAAAIGITLKQEPQWSAAPSRRALRTARTDVSLQPLAKLLTELVGLHGASGHEWSVRRYVLESLPQWARDAAVIDDIGNIVVEVGPGREATVFMAHLDEVGYEVDSIAPDGVVTLRALGGAVSSAWEGQTALLHFDPRDAPSTQSGKGINVDARWKAQSLLATAAPPLKGVFLSRDVADQKGPDTLRAWFGLDGAALDARGVRAGMAVTSHKQGVRLGPSRFTARSLDDRAGTAALLQAVNEIDPKRLRAKVIFAWSVHEEGGLRGATAMARRFGATARRIYSVDTFVSSDTPLESPHFAHAPLGSGPVLRAIENAAVSPDHERLRVIRAAKAAGVPLQVGLTQGGTDGMAFTFWGAPNQGLSWPGRYSHSPGEVLALEDLANLSRLISAVAQIEEP
jgi:putative aminopeptidase FrvX